MPAERAIMSRHRRVRRRRSKVERLRDKGNVRALVRLLGQHDWLIDREGRALDLAVARRIEAVAALGTMSDRGAEEAVVQALADSDPRVRGAAVEALAPLPGPRAARALAETAARWDEPVLEDARGAAITLLESLADEVHAVEFTQTLVEHRAGTSLSDVEVAAVRRLFAADSGPVAEIFANQLALGLGGPDDDGRVIEQTLEAIGAIAVGPLLAALDDPDRRLQAMALLGAIRDPQVVPALVGMLGESDPAVRARSARALGEIRHVSAVEALMRATRDPDAEVRDAALDALDGMRSVVAMLGAAALSVESSERQLPPPAEHESNGPGGARREGSRTFLQRLLGL
jgi:HEAT repeat protein